jgi:hypothetical protein
MTDAEALLKERGGKHGDFTLGAQFTQDVMDVFHRQANWRLLEAFHKEGIHMIVHKMQRIMTGQHDYDDHWLDVEGYARCVRERLGLVHEKHMAVVSTECHNQTVMDLAAIMRRQPNWGSRYQVPAMTILTYLASFLAGRQGNATGTPWAAIETQAREVFVDIGSRA